MPKLVPNHFSPRTAEPLLIVPPKTSDVLFDKTSSPVPSDLLPENSSDGKLNFLLSWKDVKEHCHEKETVRAFMHASKCRKQLEINYPYGSQVVICWRKMKAIV
jgi:hypothetical protein